MVVQSNGGISRKHGNNRPKTQKMGHFSHFLGPWWPYKELPRAFSLAHISYRECIGGYMATGAHSEPLTRPLGISLPLSGSNKQAWPVTHPFRSTWPTPPIFNLSEAQQQQTKNPKNGPFFSACVGSSRLGFRLPAAGLTYLS